MAAAMATQVSLTVTPAGSPSNHSPVTLTANVVQQSNGNPVPVGTGGIVTFFDGMNQLGTAPVQFGTANPGRAALTVSFAAGTHSLTASYSGVQAYSPSVTSSATSLTVTGHETAFVNCLYYGPTSLSTTNPYVADCSAWGYGLQPIAGSVSISDAGSPLSAPVTLATSQPNPLASIGINSPGSGYFYGLYDTTPYSLLPGQGTLISQVDSYTTGDVANQGVAGIVGVNTAQAQLFVSLFAPTAINSNSLGQIQGQTINYYPGYLAGVTPSPGPGEYTPPNGYYSLAPSPVQVAVADLNGDGNLDLVIAHNDTTGSGIGVGVLTGNGDGTFVYNGALPFLWEATYQTGNPVTGIAVGDLNGDGKPDIVAVNGASNQLSILINNGDGTFPGAPTTTLSTGNGPAQATIADVNNDGAPDIVIINTADKTVGVFLGIGGGNFLAMASYPAGLMPVSLAVADLNRDGVPDIAVAGLSTSMPLQSDMQILYGQGAGTFASNFAPAADMGDPTCIGGFAGILPNTLVTAIQATDINGDGYPDILVGTNGNGYNFFINQSAASGFANNGLSSCGQGGSGFYFPGADSQYLSTTGLAAADFTGNNTKNLPLISSGADSTAGFLSTTAEAVVPLNITTPTGPHNLVATFTPAANSIYGATTFNTTINVSNHAVAAFSPQTLSLNQTTLAFGNQPVGSAGAPQVINVTNVGTALLHFAANPLSTVSSSYGGQPSVFAVSTTCTSATDLAPQPANQSCTVTITFTPTSLGTQAASFYLYDNSYGGTGQYIAVYGTGTPSPSLTFSPSPANFPDTAVGSSSDVTVTLTNNGTMPVTLAAPLLSLNSPGFAVNSTTCTTNTPLQPAPAAGSSCTIDIGFFPGSAGPASGTFGTASSSQSVTLSGNGLAPSIGVSPNPLAFGIQPINTSVTRTVTVTYNGNSSFSFAAPLTTFSNPFYTLNPAQSTCSVTTVLNANNRSCNVAVTFDPTIGGAANAALVIGGGVPTVNLTGTGATSASIAVSPVSLAFGNQAVGTTSAPQTVAITNNGTAAFSFSNPIGSAAGYVVTGVNPNPNNLTQCVAGGMLNPGPPCYIDVAFSPSAQAVYPASLNITGSTASVSLTGTGVSSNISVSPVSLNYSQSVNTVTNGTITVTNNGNAAFAFTPAYGTVASATPGVPGDYVVSAGPGGLANPPCGTSLAANASCVLYVVFTPAQEGTLNGTLTIDNSTATVALNGISLANSLAFNPASLSFTGGVNMPTSPQTLTITNTAAVTFTFGSAVAVPVNSAYTVSAAPTNSCSAGETLAANGGFCNIDATFTAPALGALPTSSLTVPGSQSYVPLSGTGVASSVTVSPNPVAFSNQPVGNNATIPVVLTNNGNAPVTFTGAIMFPSAVYTAPANPCPVPLNANGGVCIVDITFTPNGTGDFNGTVTFGNLTTAPITGTGSSSSVSVSPTSLAFGSQNVGATSPAQTVTLMNNGASAVNFGAALATLSNPAYSMSGTTCGASLNAGASCAISVVFNPAQGLPYPALLTIGGVTQTVSLSGTGLGPALTAGPNPLAFGNQPVNSSVTLPVTLVNNGNGPATSANPLTTFTNAAYTSTSNNCPAVLNANGGNCTIYVTFSPGSTTGDFPGTLTIGGVATPITLSGTGASSSVSVTPTVLAFGNQNVGTTSAGQPVTLTNNGAAPVTFGAALATFSNAAYSVSSTTCGASLGVGGNCQIVIVFMPTQGLATPATLTIGGVVRTVSLTGTGLGPALTLSPNPMLFGNTPAGTSASLPLTITNNGNGPFTSFTMPLTTFTNPAYTSSAPTNCANPLQAAGSCTITVTFTPPTSASGSSNGILIVGGVAQNVALQGTGSSSSITVNPSTVLAFGSQPVNTTSTSAQVVTLTNNGAATFTFGMPLTSFTSSAYTATASTCGATLAVGASCTISVVFTPTAGGAMPATLTIGGVTQTVSLSGTGATSPAISLNTTAVNAGNQGQGTSSNIFVVATSTGTAPLVFSGTSATITGPGAASWKMQNNCQGSFITGATCNIVLTFEPTVTGTQNATLSIADNAANQPSPQQISLTGVGVAPSLTENPADLFFGSISGPGPVELGSTSGAQGFTISNTGTTAAFIGAPYLTGPNAANFKLTDGCNSMYGPAGLPAGRNCTISVTYTPTTLAAQNATLNVVTYLGGAVSTGQVGLIGNGSSPTGILSPTTGLNFGNVSVNGQSAGQAVTVTNTGNQNLLFTSIAFNGAGMANFGENDTCLGNLIVPQGTCTINVFFYPITTGSLSATLAVFDNGAGSPQTLSVTGTSVTGPVDDTASVKVTNTAPVKNRSTSLYSSALTVANTGALGLSVPLYIVLTNLPAGVTVSLPTGTVAAGPYFTLEGLLNVGASKVIDITFSNPNGVPITFTPKVYSGPVQ